MTEVYSGANANVLIGWETTYGSAEATTKDVGIIQDVSVSSINEAIESRGMSSRDIDSISMGMWRHSITVNCQYQHARLIDLALGTVNHGGTSDPYTHTCTGGASVNSFTLALGLNGTADDDMRFDGCKVNSLTIAQNLGEPLTLSAEIYAQSVITDTSAETAIVDTLPIIPSGYSSVDTGDAISQLRAWEITINNNLIKADRIGSFEHEQLVEGNREYAGKITKAYTDIKERSRFLGGSNSETAPDTTDFAGFTTVITADIAASSRSLVSTLTDCHYTDYSRPTTVGDIIVEDLPFKFRTASIVGEDDIAGGSWEA